MCIELLVCECTYASAFMSVCMGKWACVCAIMSICKHLRLYIYHTIIHSLIYKNTSTLIRTNTCTYTDTHTHTHRHTFTDKFTHLLTNILFSHKNTYIHIYNYIYQLKYIKYTYIIININARLYTLKYSYV